MKIESGTKILVVAAHPDDETLGCGGTIARAVKSGAQVSVLFLGEGISARFPFGEYDNEEFRQQSEVRQAGAERALDVLGVSKRYFSKRLCCQFDTLPLITIVKEIESIIKEVQPEILLTHNPFEVNVDHRRTYEAVESACRPGKHPSLKEIYTFEVVCSGSYAFDNKFRPNTYVDITDTFQAKLKALQCYEGELGRFPMPRSVEGLTALAQFRGMASGLTKAEGFYLVRRTV